MFLLEVCSLILGMSASFYIRIKRRDAAQRYAVAFAQWEAEWNSNGVHEHEAIHIVNAATQVADQFNT